MKSHDEPMHDSSARWRRHGILVALLAASLAGCDLLGKPKVSDRYVAPQKEDSFQVLFQNNCVGCHGATGKLGPAPPLSDKLFVAIVPDEELLHVIGEGRPGTLMPAFAAGDGGSLTAQQVKILADGIKQRFGPAGSAPSGTPPYSLASSEADGAGAWRRGSRSHGVCSGLRLMPRCAGRGGPGWRQTGGSDQRPGLSGVDQ